MGHKAENAPMAAVAILVALALVALLSIRYGVDSRHDESVTHRRNL